jgi:hypothetical protein
VPSFVSNAGLRIPLLQSLSRCDQDYLLKREIHRNFGFPAARWEFGPGAVAGSPDLRQEVAVAVTMEDQLGFLGRPKGFARVGRNYIGRVIRASDHECSCIRTQRLNRVFARGKRVSGDDEVKGDVRLQRDGLGISRCGRKQQAQAE